MDKDIEIMVLRHQVLILERQLNARVAYRPVDRSLAALSRLLPRWRWRPSSSRQRRSFAGTESSWGANGGTGDPLVALVGRPWPMSSSSSSSGSPRENRRWGCVRIEGELRGLGNSPDQTPASHAECLQRDRGFGALHHGEVATPPFVQGGAEAVPRDSQCPAHHCEPPVGHCIPPPCAGTTDSSCPIVHP